MSTKGCDNCKHRYGYASACPCNTCIDTSHGPPSNWEAGSNYVPMTNADRIRAMSDEELAVEIVRREYTPPCFMCVPKMRTFDHCDGRCTSGVTKWLQQPAGEE